MRKQRMTVLLLYVIAIAFVFMAAALAPSYDSSRNNGSEYAFNNGWYYEDDDGNLTPFELFGRELDDREITLVHHHDEDLDRVDAIGFYNYYSAVEVYAGENRIYSYGSIEDLEEGKLLGNYFSMVDIHGHHMDLADIRVVFLNTQPQTVYGFRAGSGSALEMRMIREYIPSVITPILTMIFLLISLTFAFRKNVKSLLTKKHKWLMMFAVAISFWEIADTQLLMDMNFRAGTVCLLSFESFMLLPIPLMMLLYHSCKKMRAVNLAICGLTLANYVVLNTLNFSGACGFLYSLPATHAVVGVSIVAGLVQVCVEYDDRKNRETLMMMGGYLLFAVCVVVQYLKFFTNPTESNSRILQTGVLVFLLVQISDVFVAISERNRKMMAKLENQTQFLRRTFKTLIPDDSDQLMLAESEETMAGSGSTRILTVLESDIRGFTELIQKMSAEDAINMLNHYLEVMTNIIRMHDGVVLEFVGDAIIAIFDEKNAGANHAEKAVFTAVEMQMCMEDVQAWNRARHYPEFEMGIGVTTGQAYVGYIGSPSRIEYDAIGSTINLVSRIESYSTGGQILISKECREQITKELIVLDSFSIIPKGYSQSVEVFLIGGIGDPYNMVCENIEEIPIALSEPVAVTYNTILNKQCREPSIPGWITGVSEMSAMLVTEGALKLFDNIRINGSGPISCKVISKSEKGYLVRCTSASNDFMRWIEADREKEEAYE